MDFVVEDERDGGWETVSKKKEDKNKKEERRPQEEKTEKMYNEYLSQF